MVASAPSRQPCGESIFRLLVLASGLCLLSASPPLGLVLRELSPSLKNTYCMTLREVQEHNNTSSMIEQQLPLGVEGIIWPGEIFFFLKNLWLCHTTCGILVPLPGIEPVLPVLVAQSLNHWTTGEVLRGNVL